MKNLYALVAYKNGAIIHKQFQEVDEDNRMIQAASKLRSTNASEIDSVVVTKFNEDTLTFDYVTTASNEGEASDGTME